MLISENLEDIEKKNPQVTTLGRSSEVANGFASRRFFLYIHR